MRRWSSKKKIVGATAVFLFLLVIVVLNFNNDTVQTHDVSDQGQQVEGASVSVELAEEHNDTDKNATSTDDETLYDVVKVVDGDTITVNINGSNETIRLIGIDTPETVHPSKPVECFGIEASNKAKELLSDKSVFLEADSTQGERGKYGRLLRYVFLEDGTDFNDLMVREGYAYEYTYNLPYKYQEQFKQAEQEAKLKKRGLWSDGACEEEQIEQEPTI